MTKKSQKKSCSEHHDIAAYHYNGPDIQLIRGKLEKPSTKRCSRVDKLPLVIEKSQWVKLADHYYYLRNEGLYRFWDWGKCRWSNPNARPTVIDDKQNYTSVILFRKDILALLGAVATIVVHGRAHKEDSFKARLASAKSGNLSLTCGQSADFAYNLLGSLGWKVRMVAGVCTSNYNASDSGHTVIEFYWPKYRKWILADVAARQMFVKNGTYLSLAQTSDILNKNGKIELRPLAGSGVPNIDTSTSVCGQFNKSLPLEITLSCPQKLLGWYRRVFEIPMIKAQDGNWHFACDDPAISANAENYADSYKPMTKKQWRDEFYE